MGVSMFIRLNLWAISLVLVAITLSLVHDMWAAAMTPVVETAFEQAGADVISTTAALAPVAVALVTGAIGLGVAVMALKYVETGAYPITTLGVRKRVTREPVRADEPCATCDAPETVERARATKAAVVGGAVLGEYGAVENYACERHAHRETLEAGAAQTPDTTEPEPAVATDGGTPLDDVADDIETADSVYAATVQVLLLTPVVAIGFAVVLISRLFAPKQP